MLAAKKGGWNACGNPAELTCEGTDQGWSLRFLAPKKDREKSNNPVCFLVLIWNSLSEFGIIEHQAIRGLGV